MEPLVLDIMERVGLPVLTLLGGWFGHKFRTKQKKEADILENVMQILNMQKQYISDQDEENRKAREYYRHLERKLDSKRESIRQANKCKFTSEGNGCPVLAHEDMLDEKCKNCELRHEDDNHQD